VVGVSAVPEADPTSRTTLFDRRRRLGRSWGTASVPAVNDEPRTAADLKNLSSYFHVVTIRDDERALSTRLEVRDDLCDERGALRIGAVTYAVDVATGIACGVAVLDRDLWVVTTDLDVRLTAPVAVGPLRVDAEVLRAGATTAVAAFSLHDEGAGRAVGGGTATGRPFTFEFDRSYLEVPIGREFSGPPHDERVRSEPIAAKLGFRPGEDGSMEVDLAPWLRNPWGILHGGVTACLIDAAGEVGAATALGGPVRATSELVRYLAPAKVGPVRAVPQVLAVDDGRALVEVRVVDVGADGRLVAVGTVTARRS
jgi:uncharacterized protein (TIGR00369 family)